VVYGMDAIAGGRVCGWRPGIRRVGHEIAGCAGAAGGMAASEFEARTSVEEFGSVEGLLGGVLGHGPNGHK